MIYFFFVIQEFIALPPNWLVSSRSEFGDKLKRLDLPNRKKRWPHNLRYESQVWDSPPMWWPIEG